MKKLNVEDSLNILDAVYKNVVQGVPKVSKPVEVLALDYVQKYKDKDTAIKKLLKNQVTKCTVSGFMTGRRNYTPCCCFGRYCIGSLCSNEDDCSHCIHIGL